MVLDKLDFIDIFACIFEELKRVSLRTKIYFELMERCCI